jgi:hypothetical protein
MTDFEFKIDPNKYAGMTTEEANRAMAEDERKAIATAGWPKGTWTRSCAKPLSA